MATLLLAAGPRREHAVRAEPGAGAHRAGLPAGVHGAHRRAEPDDPVQGEGTRRRRVHPGLAVHLPGADGRRHPALPARAGAGRRRPAPARRADPRPRAAVQPHLRRGVHRPRDHHAAGRCPGHATSPTRPARWASPASAPASSCCSTRPTSYAARSRGRSPTPTPAPTRCAPTGRQARRHQPARDPGRLRRLGGRASRRTARSSAAVTDAVVAELEPLQKRYAELAADPAYVSGGLRRRRGTLPRGDRAGARRRPGGDRALRFFGIVRRAGHPASPSKGCQAKRSIPTRRVTTTRHGPAAHGER